MEKILANVQTLGIYAKGYGAALGILTIKYEACDTTHNPLASSSLLRGHEPRASIATLAGQKVLLRNPHD